MGRKWLVVDPTDGQRKPVKEVEHIHSLSEVHYQLANGVKYIPAGITRPRLRPKTKGKGKGRASGGGHESVAAPEKPVEAMKDVNFVARLRSRDLKENRRFREWATLRIVWTRPQLTTRPGRLLQLQGKERLFGFPSRPSLDLLLMSRRARRRSPPRPVRLARSRSSHRPSDTGLPSFRALATTKHLSRRRPRSKRTVKVRDRARRRRTRPLWTRTGATESGSSSSSSEFQALYASSHNDFTDTEHALYSYSDDSTADYKEDELLPFLAYVADADATDSVRLGLAHLSEYPTLRDTDLEEIRDDWNKVVVYYATALSCAEESTRGVSLLQPLQCVHVPD